MPVIKVSAKWGKEKFDNLDLNTDEPPTLFKAQLFALTGVEPSRLKVMIKGGTLKDDTDWNSLGLKSGHVFLCMGTPGESAQIIKPPESQTRFVEDMDQGEINLANNIPAGFNNLGNTCYMNATLQCFRSIPEFRTSLSDFKSHVNTDMTNNLMISLKEQFKALEKSGDAQSPIVFLQLMRQLHPQFARQGNHGEFMQQDAEECWSQLLYSLKNLPSPAADSSAMDIDGVTKTDSLPFVEKYLTGELASVMSCPDAPGEEPVVTREPFTKLVCHISNNVNFLINGLKEGLQETISKQSPTLGREADYDKTSRITQLPGYLTIQYMRFFWKATEKVKAKILKKVKFPMVLDTFELCAPSLQTQLVPARERLRVKDEEERERKRREKMEKLGGEESKSISEPIKDHSGPAPSSSAAAQAPSSSGEEGSSKDAAVKEGPSKVFQSLEPSPRALAPGSCNSGIYELTAVLTHIGRSADAGHYIAWVRQERTDKWFKFDDDTVTPCKEEDILKLDGGGDWHIAYLCIYAHRSG